MTKRISHGVVLVSLTLLASAPVAAQVSLDVAKIDCAQYLSYKVANPKNIAIWLNGYHHGVRGDTVVDVQQLDEDTKKIQQYCTDNPNTPLMQAIEAVIGPRD